ncbi:Na+/H+ antiporter NhaC family protein [Anaerococcus hydrogenalis]|uniref:Sodium:proton antiporter n=1 Tax=Anaerococcus hydrogenalis TaxID=33029 RepID=A0A2N6UKT6_9FIRM|nr:Na+/H+ antiporter NhaC family protein [Anaerococcus hydrogenalis]MBS5989411.1 Na+/H+ antiporter NhaC family protein [Anaerococcus hydrogenalis]MDK7694395.1 Na+/H+ antiporter NhaC family protein [Anaerococcus hydrogenalis]MDK7696173.1 Na+/H+ antiporter NhaC family protein [Anaerococcus hydrogenalis]MDK7707422.1 Na+/H+ antiporter NhaC family protein [Anaerococcus hydrogenalis]PMC82437.1 sodium:proton antiporter [Anaerococcus hydrogenalis]
MKEKRKLPLALVISLIPILVSILIVGSGVETYASLWALLPPVVAIVMALITKEVYSSLFLGIIIGAILASKRSFAKVLDNIVVKGLTNSISQTSGIFIFLIVLGIMVVLINHSGGSKAFGEWADKRIKSRKGSQLATYCLCLMLFIDDYFNCLTSGSVMKPITDSHKISRAKLAYLIDATAAPICMIAPISSWAAAVSGYAQGTGLSGIELFIRAIPYNFYSLLTLFFVVSLILFGNDYGPMKEFEDKAIKHGDLGNIAKAKVSAEDGHPDGKVRDLVLPILVLIISSVVCLIHVGGFFDKSSEFYMDFVNSFANTDSTVALPMGAIVTLIITIIYFVGRGVISFEKSMEAIPEGFQSMVPAILILTMATSLKNISNDLLGSTEFVGNFMKNAASGLNTFLPAVIFVVAILLAFATGTSWGTFGILIPIVASMFKPTDPIFFIGISACLSGAVCGDHISPISDTTIMSSAGAGCVHVDHVRTQLPYGITVAVISTFSFIIAGLTKSALISLIFGIIVIFIFMIILKNKNK